MCGPLPWFALLQTIQECVLQLESLWVLHPHVGKWKKLLQAGKTGLWAHPAGWVRRDLEDYMGIPHTNMAG